MERLIEKLGERLHSVSFKQRVRVSFLVMIALAIGVSGMITYGIASKELQRNAFESRQETVNKTIQILDDKLAGISNSVRSLMFSYAFKEMMLDVQSNDISNYYVHLSELQYVFSQVSFNEPLIESILIATPIGDFYPVSQRRSQVQSFYESSMYYDVKENYGGVWIKGHIDKFFTGDSRTLSFITKGTLENVTNSNVFIVVNVNESQLIGTVNQHSANDDSDYFIIDAKGEEVIRTAWSSRHNLMEDIPFLHNVSERNEGAFFHQFDHTDYLVNYARSSIVEDWSLFGIQQKDTLLKQMNSVKRTTFFIMLFFLLVTWIISTKLTTILLNPLYKLQRLMREVEDNRLNVRFKSRSHDEVAQVGYQFNRMLDEINRLISDVRRIESAKRQAEMRALTAQMEPHFLYNTLNTIYCKSVLGENDEVNEMILSLSQMFQLGLSGGKDWNTLEDELLHVKQYCLIQQKCYEGLFEYELTVTDESLLSCLLPKILLQPIVENSIQHGFKEIRCGGRIDLHVSRQNHLIYLIIEDNGIGMNADEVSKRMLEEPVSKKGYALNNLVNRLQLFYGEDAKIKLTSIIGSGSRTEIWIPMKEGLNHDETAFINSVMHH
ncbi:sensor histidine kinase [Paenibacillus sp. FSL H7-0326]